MKKSLFISILFVLSVFAFNNADAQADTLINFCAQHIPSSYISDGQVYQAAISKDETAELKVTFYGGTTYRIAACSGLNDGNLIFSIYDNEGNELFANVDHKNAPYWDFQFSSTIDCNIQAMLDDYAPESGFAIMLIGFKN